MDTEDRAPQPTSSLARAGGLSGATLAAIICLGLILLLVASTIVLALIPIYLPSKSLTASSTSRQYITLNTNPAVAGNGATSSSACQSISNSMATAGGLSTSAVNPVSCTFGTQSRRRRRQNSNRRRRQSGIVRLFMVVDFVLTVCPRCALRGYLNRFIGLIFSSSFTYFGSQSVTFTIISISTESFGSISTQATTTTTVTTTTISTNAATSNVLSG